MEEEPISETKENELEARHRAGYERHPVEPGEFSDWYEEQVWPELPAPEE